jgi:hypothetical protein
MRHEVLVDLFKNRPSLAAEILVEVLGGSLPTYTEARITSIDLSEIKPAEYRADLVVLLVDGDKRAGGDDRLCGGACDPGARRRSSQILLRSRGKFPE